MSIPKGRSSRKIPTFSRPSIDLSHHGREWRDVPCGLLSVGDTVQYFGQVQEIEHDGELVTLTSMSGTRWSGTRDVELYSFVRSEAS